MPIPTEIIACECIPGTKEDGACMARNRLGQRCRVRFTVESVVMHLNDGRRYPGCLYVVEKDPNADYRNVFEGYIKAMIARGYPQLDPHVPLLKTPEGYTVPFVGEGLGENAFAMLLCDTEEEARDLIANGKTSVGKEGT